MIEPSRAPAVLTERLRLSRLTADDAAFILELLNEPGFLRHIGDKCVRTLADARDYIASGPMASYERFGFGLQLVELLASGEKAGICGLLKRETLPDVDLGFAFLQRFWSKGYAFEAASAVLARAREAGRLERILAITSEDNVASIRLLEKLGFRFERSAPLSAGGPELRLFRLSLSPPPGSPSA